jgi:predicted glycoside hydrolase/deacetylase ChbG (UPF0249 family)
MDASQPPPVTRLIVNADDFGLTPGVNAAIMQLQRKRRLTSTSLMVNSPYSEEAFSFAQAERTLRVGIHLNLSTYRPVLPAKSVPTLVGAGNGFLPARTFVLRLLTGKLNLSEVEAELRAQIELCLAQGIEPVHIDSHMHLHVLPTIGEMIAGLAQEYQIRIVRNPDPMALLLPPFGERYGLHELVRAPAAQLVGSSLRLVGGENPLGNRPFKSADRVVYLRWCVERGGNDAFAEFLRSLGQVDGGKVEVVAHPALQDDVLPELSSYVDGRQRELALLDGERFGQLLEEGSVVLDRKDP